MKPSLPEKVFDRIAAAYAKLVPTKPHNAYCDRPAVLSLLPEALEGLRVLDAGRGTGASARILVERGSAVPLGSGKIEKFALFVTVRGRRT